MRARPVIEHPQLPAFEPQLKAFLEGAFDGGIRSLEAAGYKLGDDLVNDDAREIFREGLLSAFAHTQSAVGALFIELEEKRRELLRRLKQSRLDRDSELQNTQAQFEAVANRQTILRRLIDGMLWVLLVPQAWVLNHLAFERHIRRPDIDELKGMLSIASELNRNSKRAIYLVSDLTSIVQIGDLIRIRWGEDGVYVGLHEIKSGQMNEAIGDVIESAQGALSEVDFNGIERRFGQRARTQASRMIRQRQRFKDFERRLRSDARSSTSSPAEDAAFMEALAKTKPPGFNTYLLKLPELVDDARARGIGIHGIDGCLWLVALSEKGLTELGDIRKLPHLLFHLKHPELTCHRSEIPALNKEAPLVNLTVHNITHAISRSPLIWYPKDLVLDVVLDRIRIYAQFDLDAFIQIARKAKLCLSLIIGKEAEQAKVTKTSSPMIENPKSYGVRVKFSNGRVQKLRSSLFRFVYSHLVPPSEIIRVIATLDRAQRDIEVKRE